MAGSEWEGRTVLVTGASKGIGRSIAEQFHAAGAKVALVARSADMLAEIAGGLGERARAVPADLMEADECRRAVAEVEAALGPVDVLVSCAGILKRAFVEDVTEEDFHQSYLLNVAAAMWLVKATLPGMRARGFGRIVLVSSELGLIGGPSYASYSASKWALVGLAEVMHHELAGSPVRVCAVCPGDVATDQLAEEQSWGPTGGVPHEKAMSTDYAARAILRAAAGRAPVVVIDRPHLRLAFNLMGGPRRLRLYVVGSAFKGLMKGRAAG
jgi:short-subunit dehydrogenase